MKYHFFLMTLLFSIFLIIPSVLATTDTIGTTTATDNADQNIEFIFPITASSSGILQTIGVNIATNAGNNRVAIYNTSYYLKCESGSEAVTAGWNDIDVSSCAVPITAGNYLLGYQYDYSGNHPYISTAGAIEYKSHTYGAFDNPITGLASLTGVFNMRIIYAEVPSTIDNILTGLICSPNPAEATTDTVTCIGTKTNTTDDTDVNYTLWQNDTDLLNSSLGIDILSNLYYINPFSFSGVQTIRFNSSAGTNYNVNHTGLTFDETITTTTTTTTTTRKSVV